MESIGFDQWLAYLFDHEVTKEPWYWNELNPIFLPPAQFIDYGTRLFLNSGQSLAQYSDGQVNHGLWRLISNNFSDEIFALRNEKVPRSDRLNFLHAIYTLNKDCFSVRCAPHLSHLDKTGTPDFVSPLNSICYMWWDIFVIYGERNPSIEELNDACISVMDQCLQLPNIAVKEGALHGLDHFSLYYPETCRQIISEFVSAQKTVNAALLQYAEKAKTDNIL
jgi:hypothetical protein